MSRRSSKVASKVLILAFLSCVPVGVAAQSGAGLSTVVSVVEDASGKFVVLNTSSGQPLPAPRIQYLPGGDGETVMVADFPSLAWSGPTRLLAPAVDGIKQVRIGQFQASPPICRIAVTATNPAAFKAIAFRAESGTLTVRWQGSPGTVATHAQAPVAAGYARPFEPIAARQQPADQTVPPTSLAMTAHPPLRPAHDGPLAPRPVSTASAASERDGPQPAPQRTPAQRPPVPAPPRQQLGTAPAVLARPAELPAVRHPLAASRPAAAPLPPHSSPPPAPEPAPPSEAEPDAARHVTLSGSEPLTVAVRADRGFSYKSFRLHEPERHVIDIEGAAELLEEMMPDPGESPLLKSVRVGRPEGSAGVVRLVLDLAAPDVDVQESFEPESASLSLALAKSSGVADGVRLPAGMTVVLDAGHGGSDPGAQRGDVTEKELTMGIVEKLRRTLESEGAKVLLTRADDSTVSLEDRVSLTNAANPDAFVSVHINSLETDSAIQGIETYYQTEQSKELARRIHEALVDKLGAPDRSVRKAKFYVINHTPVPAVLAEVGFISNKEERQKLISSEYQSQVSDALARGIIFYLARQSQLARGKQAPASAEKTPPVAPPRSLAQAGQGRPRQAR